MDNDIAELLDEESIEKEIVEKCEFDNAAEEIICLISSVLKNQEQSGRSIESEIQQENVSAPAAPSVSNEGGPSSSSASAAISVCSGENTAAKVSKFDGCPASWAPFWDCFASAVHENSQLDNIEKFQYLKSLSEKTAAETISGLPLTSSNYLEAIELSKARYSDKQIIISKHMDKLMQLPRVSSSEDLEKLRFIYDKTEGIV